ncbi:Helicase associated domain protein [Streptomyces sp. SAS_281]|uniref:Helicase associated domain protein n=1 Tax=Streptomyces sp. SAS_281 TaxID=3412744 RepID=UPI00403D2B49
MSTTTRPALWPHQREAVDALMTAFEKAERATAVMACGTGKTRTAAACVRALGERQKVGRVLIVVPFLELITQTLRDWREVLGDAGMGRIVAVCSDKDVLDHRLHLETQRATVTTSAADLARLTRHPGQITVAATYASLPVIAAAHDEFGLPMWDLIIPDEAHRTAGPAHKASAMIHSNAFIPAARRLYMTATPKILTGAGDDTLSMDDEKVYGEVAYRLGFSRAMSLGLLAGYRIVVPVVTDEQVRAAADSMEGDYYQSGGSAVSPAVLTTQIAILRAAHEYGLRRLLTFHNRVTSARWFASTLPYAVEHLEPSVRPQLSVDHVHGGQSLTARQEALSRLRAEDSSLVVITNARVLGEGIDVPAVDSVCFVDNRGSAVDCIQAVGRALRRGTRPGPKTATVIVPVRLKPGEDPEAALGTSTFAAVWQVVRALSAHDEGLAQRLVETRRTLGARHKDSSEHAHEPDDAPDALAVPDWLRIDGVPVPTGFARAITVQTVRATTSSWEEYYGAARSHQQVHGTVDISQDWVTSDGIRLGNWWHRQRVAFNAGRLDSNRRRLLEKLGMVWEPAHASWAVTFQEVKRLALKQGHFAFNENLLTSHGTVVLNWCTLQRTRRRADKLSAERVEALTAIGFPWDGAQDRWMRRYGELKMIYDRRGSLLRLGAATREARWLEGQRAAHRKGRLASWQVDLLAEVGIEFNNTSRRDAAWRTTYQALLAFHARTGHWVAPADLVTADGISVRSWTRAQRSRKRNGTLPAAHEALLNQARFPWDPVQERWDARYDELQRFHTAHGHLNLPTGALNSWLYQQRKKARQGTLPATAERLLLAIDARWYEPAPPNSGPHSPDPGPGPEPYRPDRHGHDAPARLIAPTPDEDSHA